MFKPKKKGLRLWSDLCASEGMAEVSFQLFVVNCAVERIGKFCPPRCTKHPRIFYSFLSGILRVGDYGIALWGHRYIPQRL